MQRQESTQPVLPIVESHDNNSPSKYGVLILLFGITVCAQLANVLYQAIQNSQPISPLIMPSLAFLSVVTIPCLLIGLRLGRPLGLGLVNRSQNTNLGKSSRYSVDENWRISLNEGVVFALVSGVVMGGLLLVVRWYLQPYLPEQIPAYGFRGPIGGLLVSIGAGIGEEVWFRFGLLTLLLAGIKHLFKLQQISSAVAIVAILLVAIPFGLAHLPQLASYGAASTFAISGTMIGNIIVSTLFGWCYWRYGLISAIAAHIAVDIVLHMLPAFFIG